VYVDKIIIFLFYWNLTFVLKCAPSTPHVIHVPWTNRTQHSKLQLDRLSRFCTARGRRSLYSTTCVNTRLARDSPLRLARLLTCWLTCC